MTEDSRFLVSGWDADLEDIDKERDPEEQNEKSLLEAAENGNLNLAKEILDKHPEIINAVDKDKYTALHRACYGNHKEMVEFLLQKGANIAATTEMGWQPLHSCCQWNNVDCARILIQHGANINACSEGGQTPLHIAASHGASYESVRLLLFDPKINPSIRNNSNETAQDIAKRSSKFYNVFEMVDPIITKCDEIF